MVTVFVALLNFLASLLPQLPAFIEQVRSHPDLSDGGKAVLDRIDARVAVHEQRLDAVPQLPVPHDGSPSVQGDDIPPPAPTRPG
jgi:hypothetical protein